MCVEIVTDPILGMRVRSDGYVDDSSLYVNDVGPKRGFHKGAKITNPGNCYYMLTQSSIFVHRLVAQAFVPSFSKHFNVVDHIDHNGHNNDRKNLRWVNQCLNSINRKKARNVVVDRNGWVAKLWVRGKLLYLGRFKKEREQEALDVARHFKQLAFYAVFMSFVENKDDALGAQARSDCYLHGSVGPFDLAIKFLNPRICGSRPLQRAVAILRGLLPTFCHASDNSDALGRSMRGPSMSHA